MDMAANAIKDRGRATTYGPKPGSHHSGMFTKGHDPRRCRNGWSNMHRRRAIEDKYQQYTDEVLGKLLDILRDDTATHAAQLSAAKEITERGWGKSVDRIAVASLTGNSSKPMEELSTQELLQIIQRESPAIEHQTPQLTVVDDD